MSRRLRYAVACSLDGFIAGPNGEYDWILMDPDIDFESIYQQYDTALIGKNTFLPMVKSGHAEIPGIEIILFSNSISPEEFPHLTVVSENSIDFVRELKSRPGKDIWLFGGGQLFRSLAKAGLVDTVEVAMIPIILSEGIPICPVSDFPFKLKYSGQRVYEKTGIVLLEYTMLPIDSN